MEMMFDKCLRSLLEKRGKTQRELADFLSISTQAVSKWCRGENMPDIALLPRIAAFLDVSIDELLGMDDSAVQKWCQDVLDRYNAVRRCVREDGLPDVDHGLDEGVGILRNALKRRPNCWFLVQLLASDLLCVAAHGHGSEKESVLLEAKTLCLRLLDDCKEDRYRNCAREILCSVYKDLGQIEQALEIADSMPDATATNDFAKTLILDGEALEKQFAVSIGMFVRTLYRMTKHAEEVGADLSALSKNDEFRKQLKGIITAVGCDD